MVPLPSGSDSLSHMLWVQQERPAVYERTHKFLEPMDFVTARLSGSYSANACTAFMMLLTDNRRLDAVRYDDELVAELSQIRAGVDSTFAGLAQLLDRSDEETALVLIQQGKDLVRRCDSLLTRAAQSSYDSATTVAVVLGTRYYKRIGGHVLNILSSIVMPLHKVDYYDEASLPSSLKTQG